MQKLVVILGPTSSGKTRLAVALARKFNGEIVSADSRQVYRGMDIGTGKDLKEYGQGKNCVPYHLIDVISPQTQFNVGQYQKLAYRAIDDILRRGKTPFLVGGTGLYIQAIVEGLNFPQAKADPKLRARLAKLSLKQLLIKLKRLDKKTWQIIDKKNRRRVERALEICLLTGRPLSEQRQKNPRSYIILQIGIVIPKEILHKKIETRLRERLKIPPTTHFAPSPFPLPLGERIKVRGTQKGGLIEEVAHLHKQGLSWKKLDQFGLEYRYVSRYLRGQLTYNEMFEQLSHAIKDFAKRQVTWFRRDKRIHWIQNKKKAEALLRPFLRKNKN